MAVTLCSLLRETSKAWRELWLDWRRTRVSARAWEPPGVREPNATGLGTASSGPSGLRSRPCRVVEIRHECATQLHRHWRDEGRHRCLVAVPARAPAGLHERHKRAGLLHG